MGVLACTEGGTSAKVKAAEHQLQTVEHHVQYMLMAVLTKELNMPAGSIGVVVKEFALRKESNGEDNSFSEVVYVSVQVRSTEQQAADLAFKFQILAMEPSEFLNRLQSELQERNLVPDSARCKSFDCMGLSNPNNGISTLSIGGGSVHKAYTGDGDGDGGDGSAEDLEEGSSNMMMMALAVLVVIIVVIIVVMVIRYRKQKRQKDAFFEKLDQQDADNELDDEFEDEEF